MTLATVDHGGTLATYADLAGRIAKTEFVPDAFKNRPEAILACLMYGQEIGLGPMQSLNTINVIKGKPSLSPEGMRALVLQAGHRIWPSENNNESVTLCGWRNGDPQEAVTTVTWTLEDAKRAGLAGGESWKKYPRAMLLARATSELCRALFPDVIAGLSYTPEEVESFSSAPSFAERPAAPAPRSLPAPANVDTTTGEVRQPARTHRPPPGQPSQAEEPFPMSEKPSIPLANDAQRAEVETVLALVPAERRDALKERWAAAGITSVRQPERFTADDAEKALALIADFMADDPSRPFAEA